MAEAEAGFGLRSQFSGGKRSVFTRYHHALDLVRAFVDLSDLGVAHHPLHGVLAHVPVATEDLHRVRSDLHGHVARVALGHAGEVRHPGVLGIDQAGGLVHQQSGCLDLYCHVGQQELESLEHADGLAELLAFGRVAHREVEGPLRDPQGLARDGGPRVVEGAHGVTETLALLPDQAVRRDLCAVEVHLPGR